MELPEHMPLAIKMHDKDVLYKLKIMRVVNENDLEIARFRHNDKECWMIEGDNMTSKIRTLINKILS